MSYASEQIAEYEVLIAEMEDLIAHNIGLINEHHADIRMCETENRDYQSNI